MTGDVYGGDRLHQVYGRGQTRNPAAAAPRGGGERIGSSSDLGSGTVRRREDLGISGDQTGALQNRESPAGSFSNAGPPPLPPGGHHQPQGCLSAPPPRPGQHPSFDAKVASEFLRLRESRGSPRDTPAEMTSGGRWAGAPAPEAFESDVARAMRDLEVRLAAAAAGGGGEAGGRGGDDAAAAVDGGGQRWVNGSRQSSSSSLRPPPLAPPPPAVSARPEHSDDLSAGDEGMLSQMDMHRVVSGGGKGKPGGLRGMWNDDGAVERDAAGERRRQPQRGGGLAGMQDEQQAYAPPETGGAMPFPLGDGRRHSSVQQTRRQGPGLKGMWGGDDPAAATPASSLRPQRQGPGLRGLWSGPDMAAADMARSEAQAAYFDALTRDVQEKRTFSNNPEEQQQQQVRESVVGRSSPYGVSGNSAIEHGTSLAGIGTPRGGGDASLQQQLLLRGGSNGRGAGGGGDDTTDRAVDRAKKAAYAEELRKQMAEKEARRAAMDDDGGAGGRRRRASTGGRVGGGGGDNRTLFTPRSDGRENHPSHSVGGPSAGSPLRDCWPSDAWSTPPPSGTGGGAVDGGGGGGRGGTRGGPGSGSDGQLSAARRRLVEDVYGGGGMGAALGGMGYRRASTGNYGAGSGGARPQSATGPGVVGGELLGDARASSGVEGAAVTAGGGPSYLRTGAGVQSLRESEHGDSKWQRRAAALEQQRALEAQIAAKARARKQEEEESKREEEEEARQQRERLRQVEVEAEEERRRKQLEQQQQLQGLYRQQEEALRKKRVGGGGRRQSPKNDGEDAAYSRAPAHGGSTPVANDSSSVGVAAGYFPPSHGGGRGDNDIRQGELQHRHAIDGAFPSGRGGGNAIGGSGGGRQARHRSSIPDVDDLPAGAHARAQVLRSSPPNRTPADTSTPSPSSWRPVSARSAVGGGGGGLVSKERRGGRSPAAAAADDFDEGTGRRGDASAAEESFPGRRRTTPAPAFGDNRDDGARGSPLRARSTLVPLSSPTLFPPFPGDTDADIARGPPADSPGLEQESFAGGRGAAHRDRVSPAAGAAGGVHPPQDEMDMFVTRWQVEHLRGGRKADGNDYCLPSSSSFSSPGGRAVCLSPSRGALPARSSRANGVVRGRGSAAVPGGNAGELEESLAATSRMVNPPSLARPPTGAHDDGEGDGGRSGTRSRRRRPAGPPSGVEDDAADLSEQSLTSDSILFYLSGQQQESMAASPPMVAEEVTGGQYAKSGRTLESRGSGIATNRLGKESSQVDGRDYPWEGRSSAAGAARPSTLTSPRTGASARADGGGGGGGGGGGDGGQMSPLTRLLAETPVRLQAASGASAASGAHAASGVNAPGDFRVGRGIANPSQSPFRSDPQAYRLATGGDNTDGGRTKHQEADSLSGEASWPSRAAGGNDGAGAGAAGVGRRARALWGRPVSGDTAGSGGSAERAEGVETVAEALSRRGIGMPWEELSLSEARAADPLHS
ncbi:unnamed protein product [Ectocarpus sp. 4 AP-2014]